MTQRGGFASSQFDDVLSLLRLVSDPKASSEAVAELQAESDRLKSLEAKAAELTRKERELEERERQLADRAAAVSQREEALEAASQKHAADSKDMMIAVANHNQRTSALADFEAELEAKQRKLEEAQRQFRQSSAERNEALDKREQAIGAREQSVTRRLNQLKQLVAE